MNAPLNKALLLVLLGIGALSGGCQFTTAHFTDVTLARSVDANKAPVERTTGFTKSDPLLYCAAQMANTPAGTKVKAVWWQLPEGAAKQLIDSTEIELSEDAWVAFSLSLSQDVLPYGKYEVALFINGKPAKTLPFDIAPAIAEGPVKEIAMTSKVTKDWFPLERVSKFKSSESKFWACVYVMDLPEGSTFTARWFSGSAPGAENAIASTDFSYAGTGWIGFSLAPSAPFPAGTYGVEIALMTPGSTVPKTHIKTFSIE